MTETSKPGRGAIFLYLEGAIDLPSLIVILQEILKQQEAEEND